MSFFAKTYSATSVDGAQASRYRDHEKMSHGQLDRSQTLHCFRNDIVGFKNQCIGVGCLFKRTGPIHVNGPKECQSTHGQTAVVMTAC